VQVCGDCADALRKPPYRRQVAGVEQSLLVGTLRRVAQVASQGSLGPQGGGWGPRRGPGGRGTQALYRPFSPHAKFGAKIISRIASAYLCSSGDLDVGAR
jgi:hypothetical protein